MIETVANARSYWDEMARLYWLTGAPLRPTDEDVRLLQRLVASHAPLKATSEPLRALMLGVTPAVAGMHWPDRSQLLAVDGSFAMVKGVWPGDLTEARAAICGGWLSLPIADGSCHVITGDGSANCVSFPEGLRRLAREALRILRPGGCLFLRCYAQTSPMEDAGDVLDGLSNGLYPNFHAFKFRFLMSMQQTAHRGVAVADVYRRWAKSGIDPRRLAAVTGWDASIIQAIDVYRDSPTVHVFPSLAEFRSVLGEHFEELSCSYATYPLAERCPVLALRPLTPAGLTK
jgi:SAM-dependent methyltransferase